METENDLEDMTELLADIREISPRTSQYDINFPR